VKNGTVTEECQPYSSYDKYIEECPLKCKNGADIVKYYAKSAYGIINEYNENNYYDIVSIIMDQLINFGPVVSSIIAYEDFFQLKRIIVSIIYINIMENHLKEVVMEL